MRQDWLAIWEEDGVKREHRFTSFKQGVVADAHFVIELEQLGVPLPETYQLERVGEPYELAPAEPTLLLKTLYCMVYNTETSQPDTHVAARCTFFYAVDQEEAQRIAEEKKQNMVGPVYIEEVKEYPTGFTLMSARMTGKKLFYPDGKPYQ